MYISIHVQFRLFSFCYALDIVRLMNRTTLMWTVVVLTTTMPLHYLTLHCFECVVCLSLPPLTMAFRMRRSFHISLIHCCVCLSVPFPFLVHFACGCFSTFPPHSLLNAPMMVRLHRLIVSLSEHYVVWLIRYFVVDPSLCFVFDLSEIRCSCVLVCWCPISRQCSIPVEWAVR